MKRLLWALLCVLLGTACVGTAFAVPSQGTIATWQTYVLLAEWAQMGIETPEGMQEEAGMQFVRVHFSSMAGEVRTEDIGEYGGSIVLRVPDGDAFAPEMYTSYATIFDKEADVYISADTQSAFDLLYQVPESWARENVTLVVPSYVGEDKLIPLNILAAGPAPGEEHIIATEASPPVHPFLLGTHRLTLSPSATFDFSGLPEEQAKLWVQAAQHLEQMQLELDFTLLQGKPYLTLRLYSDGVDLGSAEAYLDGDVLYARGDMLPEGWVAVHVRALLAEAAGLAETSRSGELSGMPTSFEQVFTTVVDSLNAWYEAQPEGSVQSEIADMQDWPRYYFLNAYGGERIQVSADGIMQILEGIDNTLRRLATDGTLVDLDGTPIGSEAMYEQSLMRQAVSGAQSWNRNTGISLSMDTISGARNFMEVSYDLSSLDYANMLAVVLRRLPWGGDGPQVFAGEIQHASRGAWLDAHLDILTDADARQYNLRAAGSRSRGGDSTIFDSALGLSLPVGTEEQQIFQATAEGSLYDQSDALAVGLHADAIHNTPESAQGQWDDCTLTLSMDARLEESGEAQGLQAGLSARYQRLEEEPALPELSDVRLHIGAETTEEALSIYGNETSVALASWLVKGMSTLPAELLQLLVEAAGFSW